MNQTQCLRTESCMDSKVSTHSQRYSNGKETNSGNYRVPPERSD